MQARNVEPHLFLLGFHCRNAEELAERLAYQAREQDLAADMRADIDSAASILKVAAASFAEIIMAGGNTSEMARACFADRLQAIRAKLDSVMARLACNAVTASLLPATVSAEAHLSCAVALDVTLPEGVSDRFGAGGGTAVCMSSAVPQPPPPAASPREVHCWLMSLAAEASDEAEGHVVLEVLEAHVLHHVHAQLSPQVSSRELPLLQPELKALAHTVTELRRRLRAPYAQGAGPAVEARSREALAVWAAAAIAHRAVASEWPRLRVFCLPLNPDDIHLLVLTREAAHRAALVVAGYLSEFAGVRKQAFTTARNNTATLELAAAFVNDAPVLAERYGEEKRLAQRREQMHWDKVYKKQTQLTQQGGLDDQLRAAEAAETAAAAKEKKCCAALKKVRSAQLCRRRHARCHTTVTSILSRW